MKAILRREFNSYFTSMLGYVFLTIFLLLTGVVFYLVNIGYMMASMTGFFSSVIDISVFFLPLLTMRLFSEDRKQKTDKLLLSAPISTWEMVIGKFFSAMGVFLVAMAITLIYPILLSIWGTLPFMETVSLYIGYILLCGVIISIGAMMSSITESQIVAAISTYGVIILTMLLGKISTYVTNPFLVKALLWLSPINRFNDFTLGFLNIEPIIYYISLIALFLTFTVMITEKRKTGKSNAPFIIGAIVIVILVNVLVTMLGAKVPLKIDFTSNKMYALSKETKEYLKSYDTDTNIYILSSEANQDARIGQVIDQYSKYSDKIKAENINPSENPTFGKKYAQNGESLGNNSVIVDGGDKYRIIGMTEFYGIDAQSGKYSSLNAENKINGALSYISAKEEKKAYLTTGHNELKVDGAKTKLQDINYSVADWNSVTESAPEDMSLLMIVRPTVDFSTEEITKLDGYLQKGGKVQLYFDVDSQSLTNLYTYLKNVWGIEVNDDVVVETDRAHTVALGQSGMALFMPVMRDMEFTKSLRENKRTVAYFPYSKPLYLAFEVNGQTETKAVLTSTDKAYTATIDSNAKTDSSKEGEMIVAALSKDNAHNSSVYVSGNTMLLTRDPSVLAGDYGLANYDYLVNLINYTAGDEGTFIAPEKALINNVISISQLTMILTFAFVVVIMPLLALVTGLLVWVKRRNL